MMAKKKTNKYWEDRWLNLAVQQEQRIKPEIKKTEELFDELRETIMKEIRQFYKKYAENDVVTEEEAVKLLNRVEQRNWSMDLADFRDKAIDGGYDQLLNREFYKSRVTRLQMLNTQAKMHLFELANDREGAMREFLREEFSENYMRSIYELHSQTGKILDGRITLDFGTYNERDVNEVLNMNWKGSNFSKRVWKNETKWLPEELEKTLTDGFANGRSYDQMAEKLNDRFRVAKNRAITLVQTEAKHVRMNSTLKALEKEGVERYIYLATLEQHTCEICGDLDNEDFTLKEAVPGETFPPIHPNCRCTIIPYIEEAFRTNTRWMRDPKTGKGRRVPRVTFNEWKKQYLEEVA